jgi:hypothetical protein
MESTEKRMVDESKENHIIHIRLLAISLPSVLSYPLRASVVAFHL